MDNFQPKLDYIKKVMLSVNKLEHFEITEEWSHKILAKHAFKGQDDKTKGVIKLHKITKAVVEQLEKTWIQSQ